MAKMHSMLRLHKAACELLPPKTSVTVGSKGTTMVFVEGIQAGQWQLILGDNLDTLTVNVFTFNGPQDVPNYSTYSYSITGVRSVFSENPWSIPTDGTIAGLSSQASYNDTVGVHWGQGGANGFGQISYAIDEYYTWSYYVNVVQIGISNAAGKQSAIEVTGSISQPPGTGAATAQGRFIWNGVSCISLVSPEIKIAAGISMEGPNTNWGVFQMVVGNVQLMEQPDVTATYFDPNDANGGTNTLKLTFPEQTIDQRIGANTCWYQVFGGRYPARPILTGLNYVFAGERGVKCSDQPIEKYPVLFARNGAAGQGAVEFAWSPSTANSNSRITSAQGS